MSDKLLSAKHHVPFGLFCDAIEWWHPVNRENAERIAAAVANGLVGGKVDYGDFEEAILKKADVNHASQHAIGGDDVISPSTIGAVASTDERLSNDRFPTAHAVSHMLLGADRITPDAIGALAPPPGDGKSYLVTGGGYVEYIPPEDGGGTGESGTLDHSLLQNRDAADQHPQSAIQYLASDLNAIRGDINNLFICKTDIQKCLGELKAELSDKAPIVHANAHSPGERDALSGYATLDENGRVPPSQLPTLGSGIEVWQDDKHYAPPKLIFGRNNNLYKALFESGPETAVGPRDPVNEPVVGDTKIGSNSATMPSSLNWCPGAYGDGRFVTVACDSNKAAYSIDDGNTWSVATLPSTAGWDSVAYGEGRFVAVARGANKAAYSINGGVTWVAVTLPLSDVWYSVAYGEGRFVAVAFNSNKAAYSTDGGVTWTASTLPASISWISVTYGNGRFIAVGYGENIAACSIDGGITWISITLTLTAKWRSIIYGGGKFAAVAENSNQVLFSMDGGVTWKIEILPSALSWHSIAYGDGVFVAVAYNSNQAIYSTNDGVTWNAITLPTTAGWYFICYGKDTFVTVTYGSTQAAYLSMTANYLDNCWKLVG